VYSVEELMSDELEDQEDAQSAGNSSSSGDSGVQAESEEPVAPKNYQDDPQDTIEKRKQLDAFPLYMGVILNPRRRVQLSLSAPSSSRTTRVRIVTPRPQVEVQGLQSLHWVVGQFGSGSSTSSNLHSGRMHLFFSTTVMWGHRLRPKWLTKVRVRMVIPMPQLAEHSDHTLHGDVLHKPAPSPLSPTRDCELARFSPSSSSRSLGWEEPPPLGHSGMEATHISLDTSWRTHLLLSAAAGYKYCRLRMRIPLPQLTEQGLQAE